ncbi:hypothetical protein FPOAC1_008583 [Fusarium poae]|uniref:hypothetical protein n=1 Tax=Fusarium poae TaxID=36050 RepID=UPI001CEB7892|nr:hypothetical protein FPOAC1_008583 [Fusarium poae]KAG8669195.1 hypothetical protein FPOAC1_008583 [Fusarium poae]
MTNPGYETPFWADLDACERAIADEKPSPLRVATYNENFRENTLYLGNRYKDNSVKHSQSFHGDGLLTVPKRRKVEMQSGKENVRTFQHNQTLSTRSRRNMYTPGNWAQNDSPPRLLGVTPLPQLSVRKKRQAHTHARVQPDQNRSLSPFSINTLPAAYEMRRPGKARSPLTNLYDRDSMHREELPLISHAKGWTGYPLPPDNNLQLPPIKSLTTLPPENQSETNGLRDLNVQILPTEKSSIIRILQEQPFPLDRLDPGPSICLLVKVGVHVAKDMQEERQECPQKEIDNLIEALEQELGDSTISYMTVRLSYRPSAFPEWQDVGNVGDAMFTTQSKIETVATASVKLHNAMSLWSPTPVLQSNPLLPLIERH